MIIKVLYNAIVIAVTIAIVTTTETIKENRSHYSRESALYSRRRAPP